MKTNYFKVKSIEDLKPTDDEIEKINIHIVDDSSKFVFQNAYGYSLTGDMKYIRELVLTNEEGKLFLKMLESTSNDILIYGAGQRGKQLLEMFPEIEWKGFIDCTKQGLYEGYPIYTIEDVRLKKQEYTIVISNYLEIDFIIAKLKKTGVDEKNMIVFENYNKLIQSKQYMTCDNIRFTTLKRAYDVGGFDGEDTWKLLMAGINEVWIFEPDEEMYQKCKERLKKDTRVKLLKKGVSDTEKRISFIHAEGGRSAISENGDIVIETVRLDDVNDMEIDFIKMDIEGEESNSLIGAKKIIQNQAPNLAISVYHKRGDIWKIPLQILEYNSHYKFEFKHYSMNQVDTVMYAYI